MITTVQTPPQAAPTTRFISEILKIVYDLGPEGNQLSLESLVEATLKLTLLHYGSLNEPRLPVPLYASDRIAYRRLQGIYLDSMEDERQPWL